MMTHCRLRRRRQRFDRSSDTASDATPSSRAMFLFRRRPAPGTLRAHEPTRLQFASMIGRHSPAAALPPPCRAVVHSTISASTASGSTPISPRLSEFGKNPAGRRFARRVQRLRQGRARDGHGVDARREARAERSTSPATSSAVAPGSDASLKPILFGSHIDSVPEGGNYDGDVGSLSAIEVAQTFAEHSVVTRHPLEVVIWQNEEGGLFGSRAVSGQLTAARAQDGLEQRQDGRAGHRVHRRRSREARPGQAEEGRHRRLLRAAHRAGRHARHGEDRHRRRRGNRRHQAVGGHGHRIPESRRHDGDGSAARRAALAPRDSSRW